MYFGVSPVAVRSVVAPRPYVRPTYTPPPRTIVRQPQIINRTVYTPGPTRYVPGPTVTRNYYSTVVRPDYGAIQRAQEAQANWDRERSRLERLRYHDRDAAMRYALLQQQLYQAQMAAQQQPTVPPPQAPVAVQNMPQPTPSVSPASPAVDLTPHQDAADGGGDGGGGAPDAGGDGGDDHASHKPHHLMLFVGLIGVAGVGGYMLMRKKKPSAKKPD